MRLRIKLADIHVRVLFLKCKREFIGFVHLTAFLHILYIYLFLQYVYACGGCLWLLGTGQARCAGVRMNPPCFAVLSQRAVL